MSHIPVRTGPLAVLLAVVSVCLAVLALLTFSTAQADLRLAEKYAQTVSEQYEREREGQQFLQQADELLSGGGTLSDLSGTETADGVTEKTIHAGSASLVIGLEEDGNGGFRVVTWTTEADWEQSDDTMNVWLGD